MKVPDLQELTGLYGTSGKSTSGDIQNSCRTVQQTEQFGIYKFRDFFAGAEKDVPAFVYDRRSYYKISLIKGSSNIAYANKVIDIDGNALVFGTPKIPYVYSTKKMTDQGHFCLYTPQFLSPVYSGIILESLPIFQPENAPVFSLTDEEFSFFDNIFGRMDMEVRSDYDYKYDLIRTLIVELIHYAQKLSPFKIRQDLPNAGSRVVAIFLDLLERQFPIIPLQNALQMRKAKQYADQLGIHSTNLNHYLKGRNGKTTSEHIDLRIILEAKNLLQQSDHSISEITYALGFEQLSHFSAFFKKHVQMSPSDFRKQR